MSLDKVQQIIAGLSAAETEKNQLALKEIRESGDEKILRAVTEQYTRFSASTQKSVGAVFGDIQNQDYVPLLVKLTQGTVDAKVQKMLLTAAWNSRLNFVDYLECYIDFVISADFELAFDAFTLLENVETAVSHQRKHELVDYVKSHISKCKEDTLVLAHDLVKIIENYPEEVA